MATVRLNVAANFVGRIWTTALGFFFIPIYLRYLGIEAYGLVGFYSTLQGVFGLLDLGLSITINREMARLTAAGDRGQQRDLLRTLETIYWGISLAIGVIVFAGAPFIATRWVTAEHLSPGAITASIRLMGLVIALQLPWGFYQGALMGLERQVFLNGTLLVTGTLRNAGAALVLWRISPSVEAFFVWQVIVSVAQMGWLAGFVWHSIPGATARFVPRYLRGVWRFAATVAANSVVGVILTQLDKLLLSRLLTLQQFGYYALAGTAASVVWMAIIPINQALFPRFTTLVELGDERELATMYHRACQAVTVALVPMAGTVALFSYQLVLVWTKNPAAAENTSLVIKLLILGTTINGLTSLAGQLQAAAGWPQLVMYTNLASAVLLVPSMIFAASRFGPAGAAGVWVLLNSAYLFISTPIMHRRLLRGDLARWYLQDLALPAATAMLIIGAARLIEPAGLAGFRVLAFCGVTWILALFGAVVAAPLIRRTVIEVVTVKNLAAAFPR